MYRKLSIDASQITLGDSINFTLQVASESSSNDNGLATLLRKYSAIQLTFRNISPGNSGQQSERYSWPYLVADDGLSLQGVAKRTAGAMSFGDLLGDSGVISLRNKASIQLNWQVVAWDDVGTYIIEGNFVSDSATQKPGEGPGSTTADKKTASTTDSPPKAVTVTGPDFGPVRLRVIEPRDERPTKVTLQEARREPTPDQSLWALIRHRTVNFGRYSSFVNKVMCNSADTVVGRQLRQQQSPFSRVASYTLLKNATEFYLMHEAGMALDRDADFDLLVQDSTNGGNMNKNKYLEKLHRSNSDANRLGGGSVSMDMLRNDYLDELENQEGRVLPYFHIIREKLGELPLKSDAELGVQGCYGILKSRVQNPPLMELIWSYWHEEGGLVQTMNALSLRFQNVRRGSLGQDPLANLNIDPLRPLGNMLWGYIEDERNRLTLNRRNLEYRYEYGYSLIGKAVQNIPVAENRTNFQRGFHSLLRAAVEFYQQANYTTVIPDGFPLLNNLREVHLLLAEGAHNQYGDLPWTARSEMLTQQWLLARPEVREFLGGRVMVPYSEPWMDRVDNMKQLQGWNPTNISHFRDLATFGEQLLLSIRYGSWNDPAIGASNAGNWAHYWREEIQRYLHAYKAVTGVDIASDIVDARITIPASEDRYQQPGALIERQTALQNATQQRGQLGAGTPNHPLAIPVIRRLPLSGV